MSQAGDPFLWLFCATACCSPAGPVARLVIQSGSGDRDTVAAPYTLQLVSGEGHP